jgi:hypothetical protein
MSAYRVNLEGRTVIKISFEVDSSGVTRGNQYNCPFCK